MADAPPKSRTVQLSASAKEAARKARVADNTLLKAGFKRAQTTSATAPQPKTKVGLSFDKHLILCMACMGLHATRPKSLWTLAPPAPANPPATPMLDPPGKSRSI